MPPTDPHGATCLECGQRELAAHGGGFKCRACGAEESNVQDGAALIAAERARQMAREGWTPEHDDIAHQAGELAAAACAYATAPGSRQRMEPNGDPCIPDVWPWEPEWWKPKWTPKTQREGRVRELVIAGALLAAEIDRLQRAEP